MLNVTESDANTAHGIYVANCYANAGSTATEGAVEKYACTAGCCLVNGLAR